MNELVRSASGAASGLRAIEPGTLEDISQLLEPRIMQRAGLGGRPVGFGEQVARQVKIARVERVFERFQLGDERAERVRDVRLIGQTMSRQTFHALPASRVTSRQPAAANAPANSGLIPRKSHDIQFSIAERRKDNNVTMWIAVECVKYFASCDCSGRERLCKAR